MSIRIGPPVRRSPVFKKPETSGPTAGESLFEQLLPASWTPSVSGVELHFPVESIRVSFEHDLAQHKSWNVDGARVESTGRSPMMIEAKIPFFNGIFPAKNEKWLAGTLYPDGFRNFFRAIANEKAGTLVHPEIGAIFCRCASLDVSHDAEEQDGVYVTAKWVESREDLGEASVLQQPSPVSEMAVAAEGLDASKTDLLALVPTAPVPDEDFASLTNKVIGLVDSLKLTTSQLAAKPGQLIYAAERIQNSINRTSDISNALSWASREWAERVESSARDIRAGEATTTARSGSGRRVVASAAVSRRPIARYVNKDKGVSLVTLHSRLSAMGSKTTLDELLDLNPQLISRPSVEPGAVVRYYK